jgi:hypothetical protein
MDKLVTKFQYLISFKLGEEGEKLMEKNEIRRRQREGEG